MFKTLLTASLLVWCLGQFVDGVHEQTKPRLRTCNSFAHLRPFEPVLTREPNASVRVYNDTREPYYVGVSGSLNEADLLAPGEGRTITLASPSGTTQSRVRLDYIHPEETYVRTLPVHRVIGGYANSLEHVLRASSGRHVSVCHRAL